MNLIVILAAMTLTFHGQEPNKLFGGMSDNTCTAVLLSADIAISANHCVKDVPLTGKLTVLGEDNKKYKAHLLYNDDNRDLILIKIDHKYKSWAKLGKMPVKGEKVYTYNSGEDMAGTYNEGIICNIVKDPETGVGELIHNVGILGGASGSGLFNAKGELIGINLFTLHGLAGADDINAVRNFLKESSVSLR